MSHATYLLALLLVSTDWPVPPGLERLPGFDAALRRVGVGNDLMYPQQHLPQGATGVYWLRGWRDVCRGTPAGHAWDFLPPARYLREQADFARRHVEEIRAKAECATPDVRWWYEEWTVEAERLGELYDALAEAKEWYAHDGLAIRRVGMSNAIWELMSNEELERGALPPPVPLWRFRRIP